MNTLTIVTIVVIVLMTGYAIFLTNQHKHKLTCMAGMMISMAVAMMSGLLSGYLIGILTGDMFLSGGVSIIIGFTVGFLMGQPIGIMAILDGALSGIMSSAIGSMFGIMIKQESPFIMLGLLLVIYIIITGLVILFIKVETNQKLTLDTNTISPFAILATGIVLVSMFLFLYSSDAIKISATQANVQESPGTNTTNTNTQQTELDLTKETAPVIHMEATESGYTPNLIYVKKGVPVVLEINNPLENSCLSTFNMPDFHFNNVNLKLGTTTLKFTPTKIGEFTFSCGMNMYGGKIIVEN